MDTACLEDLNHKWSQEPSGTRRLKVMLPQFYAALAIFAVNLSHEIFETIVYETAFSLDEVLASTMAYNYTMCIGLLVGGIVAHIIGGRLIVMLAGLVSILGWITLGWISINAVLQWMFYIVTFTKRMMQASAYVYLAEISQPNMRNSIMAVVCLSSNIGLIYSTLADTEIMKLTAFLNVAATLFGLVAMWFLPDSPYWLANKGRYSEVESSLAWFRGRTHVENVKSESKTIISNAQTSPTAWKSLGQKSIYKAGLIVGLVFLANTFVRIFFSTHLSYIYKTLWFSGYRHELTSRIFRVFGVSTVFISVVFVFLIAIIGKRIIILISLFVVSIALLVASIAGYLYKSQNLNANTHSWLLLICNAVAYFSLITGVVPVPLILNGELFPSKLRSFGAGVGLFFAQMVLLISIQVYCNYFDAMPGALLTIALVSVLGFISLLWLFPRNENKSLVEIEQSYINQWIEKEKINVYGSD